MFSSLAELLLKLENIRVLTPDSHQFGDDNQESFIWITFLILWSAWDLRPVFNDNSISYGEIKLAKEQRIFKKYECVVFRFHHKNCSPFIVMAACVIYTGTGAVRPWTHEIWTLFSKIWCYYPFNHDYKYLFRVFSELRFFQLYSNSTGREIVWGIFYLGYHHLHKEIWAWRNN